MDSREKGKVIVECMRQSHAGDRISAGESESNARADHGFMWIVTVKEQEAVMVSLEEANKLRDYIVKRGGIADICCRVLSPDNISPAAIPFVTFNSKYADAFIKINPR